MPRKKVVTSRAEVIAQFIEQSRVFIGAMSPDAQEMVLHQISSGLGQPTPAPVPAEKKAAKPKQPRKAIGRGVPDPIVSETPTPVEP